MMEEGGRSRPFESAPPAKKKIFSTQDESLALVFHHEMKIARKSAPHALTQELGTRALHHSLFLFDSVSFASRAEDPRCIKRKKLSLEQQKKKRTPLLQLFATSPQGAMLSFSTLSTYARCKSRFRHRISNVLSATLANLLVVDVEKAHAGLVLARLRLCVQPRLFPQLSR